MAEKNIGDLKGRISLENSDFKNKMSQARAELDETANSSKNLARDFGAIQLASAGVGGAVLAAIGGSVKAASDFEKQMSRVKAISGATDEEFRKLEATALDLGASTSKSASEVALGMEDMAAMGFNVNEIMAAMPGVISAAEASGSDLALTTQVVAAALNGFQMEASEASNVADVLAMTANVSAASIDDMGYALKYAAPIANSLGISIEELSATVGIMADAGIEGSQAGTTLRAGLIALLKPSEQASKTMEAMGINVSDASGNFIGLSPLIKNITESMEGQTEVQKLATLAQLVGTEAASGFLVLMEAGPDKIDAMTKSLENSAGSAKAAADIMMNNLAGAFEEFMGSLETVGIKLGQEFLPLFKQIVEAGAEIIRKFGEIDPATVKVALAFAGITAAVAFTLSTIGKLSLALSAFALTPVGAAILGLSLLVGIIGAATMAQSGMNEVSLEAAKAMMAEQSALDTNIKAYDALKGQLLLSTDELSRFVDINALLKQTSDPQIIAELSEEQRILQEKSGLTNEQFVEFLRLNDEIIAVVPESNTILTEQGGILLANSINAKALNAEQLENIRIELEAQKLKAEANLKQHLLDEKRVISEMNELKKEMAGTDEKAVEAQSRLTSLQSDYLIAEADGDTVGMNRLNLKIAIEKAILQKYKEQKAETAQELLLKSEELTKIQTKIGKLDEIKYKMVALELSQVGINAKRGQELSQIDEAKNKLINQRAELEKMTPLNQRNTDEYQDGVSAIDRQIDSLDTARSRIIGLTEQAGVMNEALSKSINKKVIIRTIGNNSLKNLEYHSGGIVGLPKLHSGGRVNSIIDNLKNAPQHNEVDVRLLKNEAVLTESQQANLMRQIDAGHTPNNGTSMEETNTLLREIAEGLSEGKDITVVMNERVVGAIVEEHVTKAQKRKTEIDKVFQGKRF